MSTGYGTTWIRSGSTPASANVRALKPLGTHTSRTRLQGSTHDGGIPSVSKQVAPTTGEPELGGRAVPERDAARHDRQAVDHDEPGGEVLRGQRQVGRGHAVGRRVRHQGQHRQAGPVGGLDRPAAGRGVAAAPEQRAQPADALPGGRRRDRGDGRAAEALGRRHADPVPVEGRQDRVVALRGGVRGERGALRLPRERAAAGGGEGANGLAARGGVGRPVEQRALPGAVRPAGVGDAVRGQQLVAVRRHGVPALAERLLVGRVGGGVVAVQHREGVGADGVVAPRVPQAHAEVEPGDGVPEGQIEAAGVEQHLAGARPGRRATRAAARGVRAAGWSPGIPRWRWTTRPRPTRAMPALRTRPSAPSSSGPPTPAPGAAAASASGASQPGRTSTRGSSHTTTGARAARAPWLRAATGPASTGLRSTVARSAHASSSAGVRASREPLSTRTTSTSSSPVASRARRHRPRCPGSSWNVMTTDARGMWPPHRPAAARTEKSRRGPEGPRRYHVVLWID